MKTTCNEMQIRIKILMKERKITQEQLAKAAGISVWTLSKQLNGVYKLNIDVLFAIFRLCSDLSPDWLLFGRGDMIR